MIRRYISKISGPLLDRIYIHIDLPALNCRELTIVSCVQRSLPRARPMCARIMKAREMQLDHFARGSERNFRQRQSFAGNPGISRSWMPRQPTCWSGPLLARERRARPHDRILKVTRTKADPSGAKLIEAEHIEEPISLLCIVLFERRAAK